MAPYLLDYYFLIKPLEAINSGFKQAESLYGIKSGLILCGMRNDKINVEKVGSIAINYKDLNVHQKTFQII